MRNNRYHVPRQAFPFLLGSAWLLIVLWAIALILTHGGLGFALLAAVTGSIALGR